MTIAQSVDDATTLIEMLLDRFDQKKVVLMGPSSGSILAMKVAAARPDLLHALVGLGQVVDMRRGEEISYQYALENAKRWRNEKATRQLDAIGHPPYEGNGFFVQRRWLSVYKGDTWSTDIKGVLSIGLRATEYSIADLIRFLAGARLSIKLLWNELLDIDFPRDLPELSVPVVFFVGRHDSTTPFELVAAYFESLTAPSKKLVRFEKSAHMPNLEEPDKFQEALVEIAQALGLFDERGSTRPSPSATRATPAAAPELDAAAIPFTVPAARTGRRALAASRPRPHGSRPVGSTPGMRCGG